MQKRQNRIGFPLIRKEGEISLTGLSFWLRWDGVQTPEMQSRLRAFPFLTGLTWGRVLPPPTHTSQPFIHPDQTVKSISQRFLSPQITPSQPARPIDLVRSANSKGLIWSEVVGTNRLLYRTKLY